MLKLTPFLLFDGACAEAMALYHACLGGDLTITRLADTPMKEHMPPEQHAKVVYAHLTSGDLELSATDWLHPTRIPHQGNTVGLYLHGGTYPQLWDLFDKLAEGADPDLRDDLHALPFGTYGHLADKYGVHWFFQGEQMPRPDRRVARRATRASAVSHTPRLRERAAVDLTQRAEALPRAGGLAAEKSVGL